VCWHFFKLGLIFQQEFLQDSSPVLPCYFLLSAIVLFSVDGSLWLELICWIVGFAAMGTVFRLGGGHHSKSSWMSQAPILHLAKQVVNKMKLIVVVKE